MTQTKYRMALTAFALALFLPLTTAAQSGGRDHLTPQEVELVKEAQILDQRIGVFIKAAERRLQALNIAPTTVSKKSKKDAELWGDLPTGTRVELLNDLAKILDEAINKIDDVSAHDENNVLVPKALRKLSAAATAFLPQLNALGTQTQDQEERAAIGQSIENVQSIIDAANKLPPPINKKKEKKSE
ncbi:MAG: hypothetical protein ABI596_10135 [Pyrinomonadaceae bacterium]